MMPGQGCKPPISSLSLQIAIKFYNNLSELALGSLCVLALQIGFALARADQVSAFGDRLPFA